MHAAHSELLTPSPYESMLEAISTGRLPGHLAGRVLVARGSGHSCALCTEPITCHEPELSLQGSAGAQRYVRLHFDCYRFWERAGQRLRTRAAGSAPDTGNRLASGTRPT